MLEIGGFDGDKRFVHAEDYDVWLKLAFLGKRFYFINEPLGEYRFHKTNNLTTDFENSLKNEKNVIDKHFGNFKTKIPFLKSILYRNRLCNIYFRCAVQHIFRKKFYKGTNYFIKCFILNPFCLIYNLFYLIKNKV